MGNEFEHVGGVKEGESIDELPASRPYQKDEYDEYFQTQVSVYGNNLVPNPPGKLLRRTIQFAPSCQH